MEYSAPEHANITQEAGQDLAAAARTFRDLRSPQNGSQLNYIARDKIRLRINAKHGRYKFSPVLHELCPRERESQKNL